MKSIIELALTTVLTIVLSLALGACTSAYERAVQRGDVYAASGQWEQAAAEYQRASQLDRGNPEAAIKLEHAYRQRAGEHVQRARALEARGEWDGALRAVKAAIVLRPDDLDTQSELTRLLNAVLDRAYHSLDEDKRRALALTKLVLREAPRHPRALRMARSISGDLATAAHQRARGYLAANKPGNALVELTRALSYQRDAPAIKKELARVKQMLRDQLAFAVAVSPFAGAGHNAQIARALSVEALQPLFDAGLPLRVVTADAAAGETPGDNPGIWVGGVVAGYDYSHTKKNLRRSCDYVCGVDTRSNPERRRVEGELVVAERALHQAEQRVSSDERDTLEKERDITRIRRDVDREQADVDKARQALDRCLQRAGDTSSQPCSSERSRLESAQRDLERARSRLDSPLRRLESARDKLDRHRRERDRERERVARVRDTMHRTPTTIEVKRYCPFEYAVAAHTVESRVTVDLTLKSRDRARVLFHDNALSYAATHRDETFRARRGRCAEVARDNPLKLRTEAQLRAHLSKGVASDVKAKIMAQYERYQQAHLQRGASRANEGDIEAAIEAYVRYALLGPLKRAEADRIDAFLLENRGLRMVHSLWQR